MATTPEQYKEASTKGYNDGLQNFAGNPYKWPAETTLFNAYIEGWKLGAQQRRFNQEKEALMNRYANENAAQAHEQQQKLWLVGFGVIGAVAAGVFFKRSVRTSLAVGGAVTAGSYYYREWKKRKDRELLSTPITMKAVAQ